MADGDKEPNGDTKRIYNLLRWYGAVGLLALTAVLTLIDVADDMWLGCRYDGPPAWLTTIVAGLFVALFSSTAIDAIKRK